MKTIKRNQKQKKSITEIMAKVVDESLLAKRKTEIETSATTASTVKKEEVKKPLKWFHRELKKNEFEIKEYEGFFYGRHYEWKKNIWIGKYSTQKEVEQIINDYVKNSRLKKTERKINTDRIHSIIIEID